MARANKALTVPCGSCSNQHPGAGALRRLPPEAAGFQVRPVCFKQAARESGADETYDVFIRIFAHHCTRKKPGLFSPPALHLQTAAKKERNSRPWRFRFRPKRATEKAPNWHRDRMVWPQLGVEGLLCRFKLGELSLPLYVLQVDNLFKFILSASIGWIHLPQNNLRLERSTVPSLDAATAACAAVCTEFSVDSERLGSRCLGLERLASISFNVCNLILDSYIFISIL